MSIILRDGTNAGHQAAIDASGNLSVAITGSIAAGSNLIGQVEISDGTNVLGTLAHPMVVSSAAPSDRTSSGTVSSSPSANVSISGQGAGTILFNITGVWVGTLVFEASVDGTNWVPAQCLPKYPSGTVAVNSTTANGQWAIASGGLNMFRVRGSLWTSGSATIALEAGVGADSIEVFQLSPNNFFTTSDIRASGTALTATGTALDVNITGGVSTVQYTDGTTVATPVGTVAMGANGGNVYALQLDGADGNLLVAVAGTVAVTQSTSPWVVSGTVTANIGTTGGLALNATLTGGTQVTQISDGTNIIGTSLNPVRVDPTGTTIQPVSGTVTATQTTGTNLHTVVDSGSIVASQGGGAWAQNLTQIDGAGIALGQADMADSFPVVIASNQSVLPVSANGDFIVVQPVAANLNATVVFDSPQHTIVDSGTITANQGTSPWVVSLASTTVTGTVAVTQSTSPWVVSGTVTANAGSGTFTTQDKADGAPDAATQPLQATQVAGWDGANLRVLNTDAAGKLNVNVSAIVADNVNQGNAGTNAEAWWVQIGDTANGPVTVTVANALKVDGSAVTQPVSGTVTANQGTSPWVVSLTSTTVTGTVAVTQSTSPWVVSGTVTANAGTGNFTVVQPTAASLNATVIGTGTFAVQAAQSGTWNIGTLTSITNALPAGTNVIGHVITDSGSTTAVTGTVAVTQSTSPWVVAGNIASGSADSGNPVKIGGVFNTTQPTVTNGQRVDNQNTARGAQIVATGSDTFNVTVNAPLAAGTNVIGHVIADSGSTTVVTGTVAVTQSGTWTVQPGNTANTTPWLFTINQGGNSATVTASNALKVDGSAVTQPVSGTVTANQGTSPWVVSLTSTTVTGTVAVTQSTSPWVVSGTITANQGGAPWSQNLTQVGGSALALGQTTMSASVPVVLASDQSTIPVSLTSTTITGTVAVTQSTSPWVVSGTVTADAGTGTFLVDTQNNEQTNFYPVPTSAPSGSTAVLTQDAAGNLQTRGPVFTDEGSLRDDFVGSLVSTLTGTVTFTNGGSTLTGAGTLFTSEVGFGQFIKKVTDTEVRWVQVSRVQSDTQLTLVSPYQGTTGSATADLTNWATTTATGGSISIVGSDIVLDSGVASGQTCGIIGNEITYLPLIVEWVATVSQRIVNQTIVFGFQDTLVNPIRKVTVELSGTNAQVGNFVTSVESGDSESTLFTFPNAGDSSTEHRYRLNITPTRAYLSIDGSIVATNTSHTFGPYDNTQIVAYTLNTGVPASATDVNIDSVYLIDTDRVEIAASFDEAIPTFLTGSLNNNIPVKVTPSGALQIEAAASQLFYDTFDTTLDTTERWNATSGNGGTTPDNGGLDAGSISFDCGTTVNGFAHLESKPVFPLTVPGFLFGHWSINLDSPVTTNNYRFWGLGNTLVTPNLTTPLVDAAGFEVGIDGNLYAVCYAGTAGTSTSRNLIADLSAATGSGKQPTDEHSHIYYVWFRGFTAFWAIDSTTNVVASMVTGAPGPDNNTMSNVIISISNGTSGALTLNGTSISDTGHNNVALSDGQFPWRKAAMAESGTSADSSDTALVVALSPNSPLPAGTNVIGKIDIDASQTIGVTQNTSPWVVSGTVTTTPPANASTNISQYGGVAVSQANPFWVEVTDGTHSMPTGDASARSIHTTVDNASIAVTGTVTVNQGTSPWVVSLASTTVTNTVAENLTQVAGAVLGATAIVNYGSTPAAVAVPAVNAFVTNTVTVSGTVSANAGSGTFGTKDVSDMTGTTPGTAPANTGIVGGIYNSSSPSPTTGQTLPLQMDSTGNLKVTVAGAGTGTSSNFAAAFPSLGTAAGAQYLSSPPTFVSGNMVPLQTDVNGQLKVSVTSVGGTFTSASNGVTGVAVPSQADYIGWNSGGNLVGVSLANPLPIQGTITSTDASVGVNGAAFPASSTQIGYQSGVNLVAVSSSNRLPTADGADGTTGSAVGSTAILAGGSDGTNLRPLPLSGFGSNGSTVMNTISSPLAATEGIYAQIFPGPPGRLLVQQPFDTEFIDPILGSSLDANLWTSFTAGSGAVTVSSALIHYTVGNTANNGASTTSVPVFTTGLNPLVCVFTLTQDTTLTGGERFWGLGTLPVSWAATTPVKDGIGYEIDSAGHLWAALYVGGVRNAASVDITAFVTFTDGLAHNYAFVTEGATSFFYVDSFEAPVAVINVNSSLPSQLPLHAHIINGVGVPGYTPTFNVSFVGLGNSEQAHVGISDHQYPFRTVTVKPASTAAVGTDGALVVAISPNNTVAVTQSTSPWVVAGGLTHNNAAPTANNVGVLPAVASTAAPTYVNGDQVLLSADLTGNLRTTVSGSVAVTQSGIWTNSAIGVIASTAPTSAQYMGASFGGKLLGVPGNPYGAVGTYDISSDMFGTNVNQTRLAQWMSNFSAGADATLITPTLTGSGTVSYVTNPGAVTLATTTTANSGSNLLSTLQLQYEVGFEWFSFFSVGFPSVTGAVGSQVGISNSHQRIGLYNNSGGTPLDGFLIGFEGASSFGITHFRNATGLDSFVSNSAVGIALASFNGDKCDGTSGSHFTSNGSPVAIDFTKQNVYRLRGAWLGAGSVVLEVLSPDDVWVAMHTYRNPNTLTQPYTSTTTFNYQADLQNITNASNLTMVMGGASFGSTSSTLRLNSPITTASQLNTVRSVDIGQFNTSLPTVTSGNYNSIQIDAKGQLLVDVNYIAGAPLTAVPSNFATAPTGSVQGVNASIFAGTTSVPSGTFGTSPTAVTGTIPVNASLYIGTTAVVTTGTAGQMKVGISGATGVTLDAAQNATAPANELVVGGVYNTTVPALTAGNASQVQVDVTGSQYVNTEGRKQTYRVGIVGFTPIASASAPTVSITGSGTKTIRITRIVFSATAATGTVADFQMRRYSALTGGTPVSQAGNVAKLDSNNAAQTAVVNQWTAAATTATSAGIINAKRYEIVTAAVSVLPGEVEWKFGDGNGQGLVLRGTSEFAGIMLSAVGTTPVGDCWVEWTEES